LRSRLSALFLHIPLSFSRNYASWSSPSHATVYLLHNFFCNKHVFFFKNFFHRRVPPLVLGRRFDMMFFPFRTKSLIYGSTTTSFDHVVSAPFLFPLMRGAPRGAAERSSSVALVVLVTDGSFSCFFRFGHFLFPFLCT